VSPTIRISQETYEHLQQHAEPFVDTPDSVIRRLLGLDVDETTSESEGGTPSPADAGAAARAGRSAPKRHVGDSNGAGEKRPAAAARAPKSRGRRDATAERTERSARVPRAPRGSLMKDEAYELPILQVLAERGGRAAKNEVLDALEPLLGDRLTALDRSQITSGEIRWRNRAQFVRLRLVERGEMVKDSPRGIWELADAGRARLEEAAGLAARPKGAR
jgi:hypothetical protein